MPSFRFSKQVEIDLENIGHYTLATWGEDQSVKYISELEDFCQKLANKPLLGRECNEIKPGFLRFKSGKHIIFYQKDHAGIFLSRILHERMLPQSHKFEPLN